MKISYSKDYRHNYVVVSDDRVIENDYRLKMLEKNEIEGILKIQERMINGEGLLCYDITSKQSLKNLFDSRLIHFEDVKKLISSLQTVIEDLQRYLLQGRHLILKDEFIFFDMEKEEYNFVFYPFYECEEDNMMPLLNFLMEHIDNDEIKVVEAVYQMADIVGRQKYTMEETIAWFFDEYEEDSIQKEDEKTFDDSRTVQDFEDFDTEDIKEKAKKEKRIKKKEKKSLFRRIIDWFKEEEEEDVFETEEELYEECPPSQIQENTVYVPWVENTEQKLYGIGKNKYHIDLSKTPITVGSLEGMADMVIKEASISRLHVKFVRKGNKFLMTDLNSTNGCFKNGIRLDPNEVVNIEPGDEIGLGKLKFIYR